MVRYSLLVSSYLSSCARAASDCGLCVGLLLCLMSGTGRALAQVVLPPPGTISTLAGDGVSGNSGDSGQATSATLNSPTGVAVDSLGNIYIADQSNNAIRKVGVSNGTISTVAGNGTDGYTGDGGLAINAALSGPASVAVDSVGNIYIADLNNDVIRKVTVSTGFISTVAGNGVWGYAGDGGQATSAAMGFPVGVSLDSVGNIYIADIYNNAIRKVTVSTGIISTVAGNGTQGYSGDSGQAISATLNSPVSVAVDAAGNVYIADQDNNVIRKVSASTGIICTVAGNGTSGYSGDWGAATSAALYYPTSLALDYAGNIYVTDSAANIRKVTSSTGIIFPVAGSGVGGYSGDGGLATAAELNWPQGIAVASSPTYYSTVNIFFADSSNNVIRAVAGYKVAPTFSPKSATYATAQTVVINAIAGATVYYTTDGTTPTTSSRLYAGPIPVSSTQTLSAIAITKGGLVGSVGTAPYTITQSPPIIDFTSGFTSSGLNLVNATIVNGALQLSDIVDWQERAAWFTTPVNAQAFATDFNYQATSAVADGIAFVLQNSAAGAGALGGVGDQLGYGGIGSSVAIKFDLFNNLGEGIDSTGFYTNGVLPAIPALDMTPSSVILNSGDLMHVHITYDGTTLTWTITDTATNANFTASTLLNIPTTVGGNTAYAGLTGATGLYASTQYVTGWTYISGPTITFAATPNFSPMAGTYTSAQAVTINDATPGSRIYYTTNGTTPTTSSTVYTGAIPVGATETLNAIAAATGYSNSSVGSAAYTISPAVTVSVSPPSATLYASQTEQFTSAVMNTSNTEVTWTITGVGTISSSGLYTAPASITSQQTVTVIATSQSNTTKSASATVTLIPAVTVSVNPITATLYGGQTQQFTSEVTNTGNTAVTWTVSPAATGTISSSGLYTAPASITAQQTVTVTATSQANTAKFAAATVTLTPAVTVSVTPSTATLHTSETQQFTSAVTNTSNTAVTWTISGVGTISSSGLYAAPASIVTQQTVTITATSQANTTKAGTAAVTLVPQAANPSLILAATTQPPYVAGTSERFVATLRDRNGTPQIGIAVTFAVAGVNQNTGSATTDINGNAAYIYTGTNVGNDTIQASAGVSGILVKSNSLGADWLVPVKALSTTTLSGEFFLSNSSGAFDTPATATPAFVQSFPVINFNPPQGTIPGNTSNVTIATRPFTDVTTDLNGNFTGTIVAQGNGYQAGVGPMSNFQAVFRGALTVASAGNVVFNFYTDDGFILGIGNGATRVSGAALNMPTVTPFSQLPAMGAYNRNAAPVGNQVVVYFPSAGTYPYEVDYTECCAGALVLTMASGAVNPTGVSPTGSLTLAPNTIQPQAAGGKLSITVLASDASGAPLPNVGVSLVITGADGLDLTATTNASGYATFLYQDVNPGTASVQAVAFISDMVAYSNVLSVPWTLPPSTSTTSNGTGSTINIGISAQNTVTLPNTLQLNGRVTDSNLPNGATLAITWSQVSGPGTSTFANPKQAVTTASFSQPGHYVLQLSANDSVNTGSVPIQITVNPAPGMTQGWIGSPVYGSTVTGMVPISLISGITLGSGILSYYPASNFNNVTVLNPNTTGSGQIGTLDTTTLANGSYWIQLQASDTSGNFGYSLVLVTVAGNYKPGRVTASVTDLVVPANGLAINIQRNYDSLNAGTSGDFGYGWSLGTTVSLLVSPKGDVTFTLGGERKTFYLTPQYLSFLGVYLPGFTSEPGLHGTLTDYQNSESSCPFDFLVPEGSLWVCLSGAQYNPPGYVYTDPSGTAYTISATGALQSIVDRSGNGLTMTASGITSTTGLSVPFVRDSSGRITQITDTLGNHYLYSYDSSGNLASVTYPNTAQPSTYTYGANHLYTGGTDFRSQPLPTATYTNGRLQSVSDALGKITSYVYNLATNTTTVTYPPDAGGNVGTATMVYDNYGMLLGSTDPLGHTTTNVYDANHNLTSVTDPLGHTNTYTYDSRGNRTSATYPKTATSTNTTSSTTYNQFAEPTTTTDESGSVRTFTYDANYNPQSVKDTINGGPGVLASFIFNANAMLQAGAIGYDVTVQPAMASQFTYDANGNLASRTDALGRTTSYTYDSLGHKVTMTVPLPNASTSLAAATTIYQYDAFGHLTQTAAPLGRTTSSLYDANGNKTSDTDALGHVTTSQYDALNRLTITTYPTQPSTATNRSYDFRNNLVDETDQAGHVTHHVYDLAGRLTSLTKAYGTSAASATIYTYYNDGRKQSETDALGHTTSYTYDAAGHLTALAGVHGNTTYSYDNTGNRISSTDANGNTTQFRYDARKRLVTTIYPDSTSTTNNYDGPGNLVGVTDQAGNKVQYTFDAANQLQTVVQLAHPQPSQNTNTYSYDNLGNLAGLTDENGHTTQNAFDLLSDLTTKTLPDGSLTETRGYDTAGNLLSLQHFNGKTTTYSYDPVNRLSTRTPDPSYAEPVISFTYTATGKYATSTDASGTTNYTYDNLDRLTTKATPEGTLNYTYDTASNVSTIASSDVNGVSVSYAYDSLNRLSTVVDNRLLSGQNTTTYSYDPASNLVTAKYPNGLQSTFNYDNLNRITSMTSSSASPVSGYLYQLSPTGNRTNATELTGRTLNWSYDGVYRLTNEAISHDPAPKNGNVAYGLDPVGNRLSAASSLSGVPSGTFSFNADDLVLSETSDANGNTLTTGGKVFTYDSENRLKTMNGGAVSIVYDAFGNRVAKTVNGVTTKYLVDDLNPTGYEQVVEELVNGVVQREYSYGLRRISEHQLISNTWTPSFYGYDGGGTVRQLTNSAGVVTDKYDYDAFGNLINSTGTTPNNYLYRGEQYDPNLNLYYLRARYYNSATGRFMNIDPLNGMPDDPASLHKYLYGEDDPVDLSDPSGRAAAPVGLPQPEPEPEPRPRKGSGIEYLILLQTVNLVAHYALPPVANRINCILDAEGSGLSAVSQYLGDPQDLLVAWATCSATSMGTGRRKKQDPTKNIPEPNPGPNPSQPNGCNPCPPDSPYWEQKGKPETHGCPDGIHYHWIHYNQRPDCQCKPDRMDSCKKPDPGTPWTPGTVWP